MYDGISLNDYQNTDIYKAFKKDTANLIAIRKQVTRHGKTFMQTYYVTRKDFNAFKSTEQATEFLLKSVEAHKFFTNAVARLAEYNEELAKGVYEEMEKTQQSYVRVGEKIVETAKWAGRQQTNLSDFLVALQRKGESFTWKDVEKTYRDITYKMEKIGLKVTNAETGKSSKISSSLEGRLIPENWEGKIGNVMKAMITLMSAGTDRVRKIFKIRREEKAAAKIEEDTSRFESIVKETKTETAKVSKVKEGKKKKVAEPVKKKKAEKEKKVKYVAKEKPKSKINTSTEVKPKKDEKQLNKEWKKLKINDTISFRIPDTMKRTTGTIVKKYKSGAFKVESKSRVFKISQDNFRGRI